MENNVCTICGAKIDSGTSVCPVCGAVVSTSDSNSGAVTAPLKNMQPQKSSGSAVSVTLTVVLSVLLAISVFATVIFFSVGEFFSEQNVRKTVDNLDIYEVVEIAIDGDSVAEFFGLDKSKERKLKKILDSDEVRDFVAGVAVDYIDDIRNDTGDGKISASSVVKLIKSIDDDFAVLFDADPSQINYDSIKENIKKSDLDDYSVSELREDYAAAFTAVKIAASGYCVYVLLVLDLILLAAIVLVNKRCISRAFAAFGAVFAIDGLICVVAATAVDSLSAVVTKLVGEIFAAVSFVVSALFGGVLLGGVIIVIVGVVCIALAILINTAFGAKKRA